MKRTWAVGALCLAAVCSLWFFTARQKPVENEEAQETAEPVQTAAVYGKVKEVYGNVILLDLAEEAKSYPSSARGPEADGRAPTGSQARGGEMGQDFAPERDGQEENAPAPPAQEPAAATETGRAADESSRPVAEEGSPARPEAESSERERSAAGGGGPGGGDKTPELNYIGEYKEYSIPVGTPVITVTNQTADFNSLKTASVVRLTLLAQGERMGTVVRVEILSQPSASS